MPSFSYEAVEPSGRVVKGSLEAESASVVLTKLQSLNYTVVDVVQARSAGGFSMGFLGNKSGGRVKLNGLVVFSRQFATMVNAGINILKCLDILEAKTKDPVLKPVISEVRKDVIGGAGLTGGVAAHPKVVSKLFGSIVTGRETAGEHDTI